MKRPLQIPGMLYIVLTAALTNLLIPWYYIPIKIFSFLMT